jgi:type IV pilus assembly protein PilC
MSETDQMQKNSTKKDTLDTFELSLFCQQMALVLKSGIAPVEGVPLIAEELTQPRLKKALDEISDAITQGASFHEALRKQSLFPEYLVSMTELGEKTGMLDRVMDNLSKYYDRDYRLQKKFRSSITYPLILMGLMLGVILLLILKILPMFANILSALGGEMPKVTTVLLSVGQGIIQVGPILIGVIVAIILGLISYGRTDGGELHFDKMRMELPYLGKIYRKVSAARFSHGMALVLRSGMTFEEGLDAVEQIIGNRFVRTKIMEAGDRIRAGETPADAFAQLGLYPNLFIRMMRIGHKTGELDQMMGKISDVYDDEVEDSLNLLANAIEPILVITLSVIVAVILLAVMLPLINIMSTIG